MPLAPGTGGHLFGVDEPDNNTALHVKRQVPPLLLSVAHSFPEVASPVLQLETHSPTQRNISLTARSSRSAVRGSPQFAVRHSRISLNRSWPSVRSSREANVH